VEEKVRILRQADGDRTIVEGMRWHNLSEQTFPRWKKNFGLRDLKQARRLKELKEENGEFKSFYSRFPDECLNRKKLWTLTEARGVLEDWRREYNEERPHQSLGLETPKPLPWPSKPGSAVGLPAPSDPALTTHRN
jgi:hypothetical protein